jgi:hypothetical protein
MLHKNCAKEKHALFFTQFEYKSRSLLYCEQQKYFFENEYLLSDRFSLSNNFRNFKASILNEIDA